VGFRQLKEYLAAMLCVNQLFRENLDGLEDLGFEISVNHHSNSLLQYIVAKLVGYKSLNNLLEAKFTSPRLESELSNQALIVLRVRARENELDLASSLTRLEALLNDI